MSADEVLALCDGITSDEALMAVMLLNVAGFEAGEIGSALVLDSHKYNSLLTDGIEAWRHDAVFRAEYDRLVKEVAELYRMAA